jgi:hypothetical protein
MVNGEFSLKERISTNARSAPAAAECSEIVVQKYIIVMTSARKKIAKMYDFRKAGMGNRNIIYEVAA